MWCHYCYQLGVLGNPSAPGTRRPWITLTTVLTLWPRWQVGDVLCHTPFSAFFPPCWQKNLALSDFCKRVGRVRSPEYLLKSSRVEESVLWHNLSPWGGQTKNRSGDWTLNYSASDGHEISDSKTGICGLLVVGPALFFGQISIASNFIKESRFEKSSFWGLERQRSWLLACKPNDTYFFLYEGVS